MRRHLPVLIVLLFGAGSVHANGLLVPVERTVPPLAMLDHQVTITVEDQVAVTRVEQTFRNHTDRPLEATYVFPVPKGASLKKFTMWVGGKETKGELVPAAQATQIYTDIVRRTLDPGLLEYMGNGLLRMKVFPVPAHGDQKVALSYTAVAARDGNLVEYVYPLKTDGKATRTLEKFSIQATLKAQHPLSNIYSPTHAISVNRPDDRHATVTFERNQALLDKDFQLFYAVGDKDVGMTALTHRPISTENGYFMLLLSPRVELPKDQVIPRDLVLVLDTSGSMAGPKMDQARKALKYCLDQLGGNDRFALINFATTVNRYSDRLLEGSAEQVERAKKWVDELEATGGTAIDAALASALELRSRDTGRSFTVVFFTDGCPTIGETEPDVILKHVADKNTANTRIFTFGVGDDVNATLLDQLADRSRALSTYVRPAEDIEAKVSGLYGKISHPVLANLKLAAGKNIQLLEVYPPELPDLFHGGQVVVLGRYRGQGPAALTLSGLVGKEKKEYVYETTFAQKTDDERSFVEDLWARRKVGYLLDQIRANGEKKELVDEVVSLAKHYGIATPYTSYLIVPDAPVPVTGGGMMGGAPGGMMMGMAGGQGIGPRGGMMMGGSPIGGGFGTYRSVTAFAKDAQKGGDLGRKRGEFEEQRLRSAVARRVPNKVRNADGTTTVEITNAPAGLALKALEQAKEKKRAYDDVRKALAGNDREGFQTGRLGVDLAVHSANLRSQSRLEQTAQRQVYGRTCLDFGGVWIDDQFDAKMPIVTVKAMSDAYFRMLELHPKVKDVYRLGNYLVWVTPSGTALAIDANGGREKLTDAEIKKLFAAKK